MEMPSSMDVETFGSVGRQCHRFKASNWSRLRERSGVSDAILPPISITVEYGMRF